MEGKDRSRKVGLSTPAALRYILKGNISFVLGGIVIYLIEAAALISPPFFQEIYTDSIITHEHPEWFTPLLVIYCTLFVFEMVAWISVTLLRKKYNARLGITMSTNYLWTVLRLPMTTFNRYTPGELVARYTGINKVIRSLEFALPSIAVFFIPIISFVLLLAYNWKLGLLEIFSVLLLVYVMYKTSNVQKKRAMGMEVTDGRLQNVTMEGLSNLETIKSMGGEQYFFANWDKTYTQSLNARVSSTTNSIYLSSIPLFVLHLSNAALMILGTWFILQGEMTPGMLLASQGLANTMIAPINKMLLGTMVVMRSNSAIQRLKDVTDHDATLPDMSLPDDDEIPEVAKLRGDIELRDVTFGYDRNQPPLLRHFSLKIKAGERIALVGASGSGKSTVISLISGLYEPWEGEVLFDGKPRSEIHRMTFQNSVSVINQDVTLFEGTLADNVKMWDDSIEDFAMVMACHQAQIHQEILARPNAYHGEVYGNGKNFSGGQRQRIEIATALAQDPTILLMDEGTSALDPETEKTVMKNIYDLGTTLVVIAHRLSTIHDCDQIYVVERGQVTQHGTHDELMQMEGLYKELMKYA